MLHNYMIHPVLMIRIASVECFAHRSEFHNKQQSKGKTPKELEESNDLNWLVERTPYKILALYICSGTKFFFASQPYNTHVYTIIHTQPIINYLRCLALNMSVRLKTSRKESGQNAAFNQAYAWYNNVPLLQ